MDVLIGGGKILEIGENLVLYGTGVEVEEIDASGLYMFPGLIDQHVHMAGGGGEGGFHYRTPEISLSHLTTAGVTTAVQVGRHKHRFWKFRPLQQCKEYI